MSLKEIDAKKYDTDKLAHTHYLQNYERYFETIADEAIVLLELGINKGGSLFLWRDYFKNGLIVGLDIDPAQLDDTTGRIRTYQGQQQDTALLDRIARETAPHGFDVIIDDCSHVGALTRASFWHLFDNHLKHGGLYVIEDWGTGYWDRWVDGVSYKFRFNSDYNSAAYRLTRAIARLQRNSVIARIPFAKAVLKQAKAAALKRQCHSHNIGLVGFVKELVDECGMGDITHQEFSSFPYRKSKFREMRISHGHVFIVKA